MTIIAVLAAGRTPLGALKVDNLPTGLGAETKKALRELETAAAESARSSRDMWMGNNC